MTVLDAPAQAHPVAARVVPSVEQAIAAALVALAGDEKVVCGRVFGVGQGCRLPSGHAAPCGLRGRPPVDRHLIPALRVVLAAHRADVCDAGGAAACEHVLLARSIIARVPGW